jgi:hypothetical protein
LVYVYYSRIISTIQIEKYDLKMPKRIGNDETC